MLVISLKNKMKSSGPKWLPWGTPEDTKKDADLESPILTNCVRPSQYERIQANKDE